MSNPEEGERFYFDEFGKPVKAYPWHGIVVIYSKMDAVQGRCYNATFNNKGEVHVQRHGATLDDAIRRISQLPRV